MKKRSKLVVLVVALVLVATMLTGCDWAGFGSSLNDLKGSIKGNTYECQFYSNSGELFMTAEGKNINMRPNIVNEYTYSGENWEKTETMSSVITITIDGKQIESCGSQVFFFFIISITPGTYIRLIYITNFWSLKLILTWHNTLNKIFLFTEKNIIPH